MRNRLLAATLPAALMLAFATPVPAAGDVAAVPSPTVAPKLAPSITPATAPEASPVVVAPATKDVAPGAPAAASPAVRTPELRAPAKSSRSVVRRAVDRPVSVDEPLSSGQVVFQVLLAEIALQRGDLDLASRAWTDLAQRTRDARALERAVEVAGYSRRLDLALESARLWLEIEPTSARAQQMLAGVLVVGNRFDELAPLLIRMLENEPQALPGNLLGLNRMLARSPDRAAVSRLVDQVSEPFLRFPEANYARAVAANSAGVPSRAIAEVRRAQELRPDWDLAALLEAQLLARESNAAAVASLERFVARNPGARDVRLHLARALIGESRYADARSHFDTLLRETPDNAEALFPAAILALQMNDVARADKLLRQLLGLDFPDKSVVRYYLGQIAEQRQQGEEAIAFYQTVGVGDQYLPAQLRAARLLGERGQSDDALSQLRAAKPRNAQERAQLIAAEAQILRDAKRTQEAFALVSAELAKQPADPELLYETALLAEKLGRVDLLEKHLRRLIELKPDSASAYNALGYSLAERNLRLDEARTLIEKALSLAPDDPFILDSLGWVLYRQGDLAGAQATLERAFSLRADPEIAAHLGEVLWQLNRRDDASRLWRDAQKRSPGNEALAEAIKRFTP
ncbi:tetratricopeptide repeat protein [Rhodocyclus tenuis]|uniref:Tetratricopeptide (TPR) repeat protein n=1 Tax=Rhodocyclus tenuis TaxID=1066 RepID=A0A840G2V4_RHOTE|nr:tetratricopeptide repeat protein [Rhodocyclus tenuis]MBB4246265.1 tetratricopeptide (TPR) repeat protein [Rhodocyclus tenuis]